MKKVAQDGKKSISAEITKLGYINCDLAYHHPQRAVMMKGLVLNSKRQPMPSVQLWGTGRDYQGRTPDATGADGCFGAMIAQFDSEVDVEVQYRKESERNDALEVFFENPKLPKDLDKDLKNLVSSIAGKYVQAEEVGIDSQPAWEKPPRWDGDPSPKARIAWNSSRRRWEHLVGYKMALFRPAGDEPGLPFGDGWFLAAELGAFPHVPKYHRSYDIMTQSFGPFKTGPPGEFVDVGELVTDA